MTYDDLPTSAELNAELDPELDRRATPRLALDQPAQLACCDWDVVVNGHKATSQTSARTCAHHKDADRLLAEHDAAVEYAQGLDRWSAKELGYCGAYLLPPGGTFCELKAGHAGPHDMLRCARCEGPLQGTEQAEVTQLPYGTHPSLLVHQECMTDQDVVA